MSDADKISAAFEGVEALSVNTSLLEYYTSMTEHHRTKISVIGGAYLVLSQLMLITPQEVVLASVKDDQLLFAGVLGLIMSLLFLGILHHAANIGIISTQRLNVLRNIYWVKLPEEETENTYQVWKTNFEVKHRDIHSVSRLSMAFAVVILAPIFVLTIMRYHSIVVGVLAQTSSSVHLFLGVFYAFQLVLFVPFLRLIAIRTYNFYKTRDSYKIVQNAKSRKTCLGQLKEKFS
ncbi:MAG: hypothetical protein Q8M09_12260 [Pseudomonadota bacterium]|nr:hypothetical protein [Pseudomonadota bacterium]MDP1905002.1 hypothetical protein [Pseudomonadota bacterium]